MTATEVQALFDRVPSLVVTDGLDEVGSTKDRERVVKAIETFCNEAPPMPWRRGTTRPFRLRWTAPQGLPPMRPEAAFNLSVA